MTEIILNDVVQPTAEEIKQAKLAAITPELLQTASAYRTALQRNFGVGSETDTAITQAYVTQYFAAKAVAGTITTQELADKDLLLLTFPIIAAWTGDGTAWSFPWELVK